MLSEVLEDGAVLVRADSGDYFELNEPGARVWELIERASSFREIVAAIVAEFDVEEAVASEDTKKLISALRERGLLVEP